MSFNFTSSKQREAIAVDVPFAAVLAQRAWQTDHELADIIEADARGRIAAGHGVTIERYLQALSDLSSRPIAMDAAIEFALRWAMREGASERQAAVEMISRYPALRSAIMRAVELDGVLLSTEVLNGGNELPELALPGDFGPRMGNGRRRYELREMLGAGSQGVVYLAHDRVLSEQNMPAWVAIKRVRWNGSGDPSSQEEFLNEARRARRIAHPGVVRVLDCGVDDTGAAYVVYEYVMGHNLMTAVQAAAGLMPPRKAAALVAAVARAVHAAHQNGIVHGDLKPANIIVDREQTPRVIDFGIATRIDRAGDPRSKMLGVGSLGFTAPEQLFDIDARQSVLSDVYALGGVLYFLLTRELPNGRSTTEVESLKKGPLATRARGEVRDKNSAVPEALEAIVLKCLEWDPDKRYPSADALAADLQSWIDHRPVAACRLSVARRAALLCRRQPVAVALGVLALVALVAGTATAARISAVNAENLAEQQLLVAQQMANEQESRVNELKREQSVFRIATAGILKRIDAEAGKNISDDWFPTLSVLEAVTTPIWSLNIKAHSQEEKSDFNIFPSMKVKFAKSVIRDAKHAGAGDDVAYLFWQDGVAFWQIRRENYDEAAKILKSNEQSWKKILRGDDTWWQNRWAMELCCEIHALKHDSDPAADRAHAAKLEVEATTVLNALHKRRLSTQSMARLLATDLVKLYEPDWLNDPEKKAQITKCYLSHEESVFP